MQAQDTEMTGRDEALEWRDQQIKDLRKYLDDDHAEHKERLTLIRDWLLTIRLDGPSPRSKWETVKYTGLAAFLKDYPDAYEWLGPRALPGGRVWPD